MTRNTTRRVEVAVPILDKEIRDRIYSMFQLQFQDDEKGKEQDALGVYKDRQIHDEPVNSQEVLYERAYIAAGEKYDRK